ncbi:hypothetical protein [Hymenobacter saemangeumensis]|uniref:hypothetical protein n=1 Tax=Hymenobacter saemangeumensis TaxID=1084522 RepID=UPI0031EE4362
MLDSLGGLASAAMLGLVLPRLEHLFGMPPRVLYVLTAIACVFAAYSFICFLSKPKNQGLFLRIIAVANLLYCCLTIGLLLYQQQEITFWGVLYFVLEIIVVIALSVVEISASVSSSQ